MGISIFLEATSVSSVNYIQVALLCCCKVLKIHMYCQVIMFASVSWYSSRGVFVFSVMWYVMWLFMMLEINVPL